MAFSRAENEAIDRIAGLLIGCNRILFVTGAGVSADSGLPTYRGIGGLYEEAHTPEGLPIERIMSGDMMLRRPEMTWKYLSEIERACRGASYNRGHRVIAEMESHFPAVWVLTQNVDGFHRQAGSRNIIDIHGDMHDLVCIECGYRETVTDYQNLQIPPACPVCRGLIRPDVILFGELLSVSKLDLLQSELADGFDAVFSVGTTSVFPYIAQPVIDARLASVPTVEINPGITDVSGIVDEKIAAGSAETLDAIWTRYRSLSA